ncbi:hypothetical protein ABZP36_026093 [Zizania latifolia]
MLAVALVIGAFVSKSIPTVQSIGVCYGVVANNLPSPADVVPLYKSKGITAMRIYKPDAATLRALAGTNIGVIVDAIISELATPAAASAWVKSNIQPYEGVNIKYIAVGNEVEGSDTLKILPAMQNLNKALAEAGFGNIKVSTAVKMNVLATSSPPSNGKFGDPSVMDPIVKFLSSNGSPLLANVYPYFAYKDNSGDIDLNFALFQASSATFTDNGKTYKNLFVAMVDAIYSALEKAGASGVPVVVSESGWPSAGGFGASTDNAQKYNQGLIDHVGEGTPKRPDALEAYIFAMFNENLKPGLETEKHFGEAVVALTKFACTENQLHVNHCKAIVDGGGGSHLVQLVYFGEQMQIEALMLLCYIAMHVPESEVLAQAGVLSVLLWASKQIMLLGSLLLLLANSRKAVSEI